MNKLFLMLSGLTLAGMTPMVSNLAESTNSDQKVDIQVESKEVTIGNSIVNWSGPDIVLRTQAINLTALGIGDNSALNQYVTVELSDFEVNFLDGAKVVNDGYKWGAKMSEGEGDWATISKFEIRKQDSFLLFNATIERKHSLWYDSNGDYNLALVYRFNCVANAGKWLEYGQILARTGAVVKFY